MQCNRGQGHIFLEKPYVHKFTYIVLYTDKSVLLQPIMIIGHYDDGADAAPQTWNIDKHATSLSDI